jgi:hypothetical protein
MNLFFCWIAAGTSPILIQLINEQLLMAEIQATVLQMPLLGAGLISFYRFTVSVSGFCTICFI